MQGVASVSMQGRRPVRCQVATWCFVAVLQLGRPTDLLAAPVPSPPSTTGPPPSSQAPETTVQFPPGEQTATGGVGAGSRGAGQPVALHVAPTGWPAQPSGGHVALTLVLVTGCSQTAMHERGSSANSVVSTPSRTDPVPTQVPQQGPYEAAHSQCGEARHCGALEETRDMSCKAVPAILQ